jgi:hypothetical protein
VQWDDEFLRLDGPELERIPLKFASVNQVRDRDEGVETKGWKWRDGGMKNERVDIRERTEILYSSIQPSYFSTLRQKHILNLIYSAYHIKSRLNLQGGTSHWINR